ncbi:multidrug transporter CflA [Niabella ginsenosidivorans]|uniref:Multidrug transporter CflA n=1 Tax=Niabella ginsenosidivorans TaxID=1176587 RepID=A0A1A9I5S0_9BACT|nr:MFS transporter [Niabella ginsenosidivorans]ANH82040.1 multidrug transporter CflA [Niabella ginsenosidivorans]
MRSITNENSRVPTVLAFILIPISGFAMDVYVPSFPQMVKDLNATTADIRFTLTIFLVSYGVSQLFVGSIVDSFGRYRACLAALLIFATANVIIVMTRSVELIFVMRAVQGVVISVVMVAKRSLFIDLYTGTQQQHYTSLLSIIWSAAPILAPFLGGYLEHNFGWRANFWFLAFYGFLLFLLELFFSGETLKQFRPFHLRSVLKTYVHMLQARDFSYGVLVLGLSYSMAIVFGMSAPFIIETVFHYSAIATGYSALLSGISLLLGGILSKWMIHRDFFRKLSVATVIQLGIALIMLAGPAFYSTIFSLMGFVMLLHFLMGFVYNIYFTYCLTRFPANAGISGGVTSGGAYIVTSLVSYGIVSMLNIHSQRTLAVSYILLSCFIGLVLVLLKNSPATFLARKWGPEQ